MKRMVKIGGNYGKPFSGNRGAGQGNTFAVFSALGITTVEFKCLDHQHPTVTKTSAVDDRTFRGPNADVINAVHTALAFDKCAGLKNNLKKFVALSTCAKARARLKTEKFNGAHIRVSLEDVLVGANITVRRSVRRTLQDERVLEGIAVANRVSKTSYYIAVNDTVFLYHDSRFTNFRRAVCARRGKQSSRRMPLCTSLFC